MNQIEYVPRLIAWEVTRSCMLNCKHCRASAEYIKYKDELTTEEIYKTLDNIVSHFKPIIILTGGDPMLRDDIYDIAKYGTDLGLRMVMAPCGQLLTKEKLLKLKASGIERLSFSIDGATAESHDDFRGVDNSYKTLLNAMKLSREVGMAFQINSTITKANLNELEDIIKLAVKEGAVSFHPFLLVPTGKAKKMVNMELSPEEYEDTLNWIYKKKLELDINIKPTCAPHFYRIFRQNEKKAGRIVRPDTHGMDAMSKGCMGGQSFAFISHTGKLQICGFMDIECGDIREANYDFKKIWDDSTIFKQMRDLDNYKGRCGYCEYRKFCGGCRARAFGITGNYLDEEPYCIYKPKKTSHM